MALVMPRYILTFLIAAASAHYIITRYYDFISECFVADCSSRRPQDNQLLLSVTVIALKLCCFVRAPLRSLIARVISCGASVLGREFGSTSIDRIAAF